eukprot:SAG31_NODE_39433_length_288_cov_0.820106_1_plen_87_part_10
MQRLRVCLPCHRYFVQTAIERQRELADKGDKKQHRLIHSADPASTASAVTQTGGSAAGGRSKPNSEKTSVVMGPRCSCGREMLKFLT